MDNNLVKLNEETYMTVSDKGDIKLLQGNFTEENIKYIVGAKNEIESKENDIKSYEELLGFIKFKRKASKFMMYYRILMPIFFIALAIVSPLTPAAALTQLLITWFELSFLGEFLSRCAVFVVSCFLDNSTYNRYLKKDLKKTYSLGTNKKREKEEQEHIHAIEVLKKEIEKLEESIQFLKNVTKCKEVPYMDDEKVTIAPIDRSLEETTIKISSLSRTKRK
ncbi:MAG: hypothetical protein IJE89_04830 [Bacilli bacterium]|nr:hypothetical protein [Bacilli bacterium]